MRRGSLACVYPIAKALLLSSAHVSAAPPAPATVDKELPLDRELSTGIVKAPQADRTRAVELLADAGFYAHLFGSLGFGRGLRLNNPFRLSTQLGQSGESLSLTQSYFDVAVGATLGAPDGLQHGAVSHVSVAVHGVRQEVLALGYLALYRFPERFMLTARASVPVILEPDLNAGLEAALGGVGLLWAGLGINAEIIYSMFYGAATQERDATVIPVVSLQLSAWIGYEVLP